MWQSFGDDRSLDLGNIKIGRCIGRYIEIIHLKSTERPSGRACSSGIWETDEGGD